MRKKERAKLISELLDELFPHPNCPLAYKNPYTLLIAVLLSGHSTDKAVNKVTPFLFKKATTAKKMLLLSQKTLEEIIRPCGLFKRKAKAILELSRILVQKTRGKVPSSIEELEKLPGVGHKTASVVMFQAFHSPAFPVDTHIHRCANRWKLSFGKNPKKIEEDLKRLFCKKDWGKIHLQIILYARSYCPARGHQIENCPICQKLEKCP